MLTTAATVQNNLSDVLGQQPPHFSNVLTDIKEIIMKLRPTLTASLFAIAAVLSFNVSAASDTPTDAKPDAQAEKADAKKKVRPHSHMEEKLGIKAQAKDATADEGKTAEAEPEQSAPKKPNPAKDKSKHFHPRDGGKL